MDDPSARIPRLDVVLRTVSALREHAILSALGGSGLLAALGLTNQVRDWDLTTDAEPALVTAALTAAGLQPERVLAGDGGYATRARFRIDGGDHEVDLIVGFGFQVDGTTTAMPTRVTGYWRRLPLGDPAVWAHAYRLIGRPQRAAALQGWLARAADRHDRPVDRSPGPRPPSAPDA